ncbi:MAG TPA: SDR family NAD(P)-dependent oxidoreductase [Rhodospirillales bacterium]
MADDGKENVLVSGGSGGIGAALCRRLAAAGYRPIVGYGRNRDTAETIAGETDGVAVALDLTDAAQIERAVAGLEGDPRRLAGLVLAASPPPLIEPVFREPAGEMERQWAVNVLGAHKLLDGVVRRLMRRHKRGWIVGVLSAAMHGDGAKNMGAYVIAKHGLCGLLTAVAAEYPWLAVIDVRPGLTETPMLKAFDERFLESKRAQQPGSRFRTPDEVAREIMERIAGS